MGSPLTTYTKTVNKGPILPKLETNATLNRGRSATAIFKGIKGKDGVTKNN